MTEQLRLEAAVVDRFSKPLGDLRTQLRGLKDNAPVKALQKDWADVGAGLRKAGDEIRSNLAPAMSMLGLRSLGVAGGIAAVGLGVRNLAFANRDISLFSREIGMSANNLKAWQTLGERFGISAESMRGGLLSLADGARSLRNRWGEAYTGLRAMNLTPLAEALVKAPDFQTYVETLITEVSKLTPDMRRKVLALFGLGPEFSAMLGENKEKTIAAFRAIREEQAKLGPDAERDSKRFVDAWNHAAESLKTLKEKALAPLLELSAKTIDGINKLSDGPIAPRAATPEEKKATSEGRKSFDQKFKDWVQGKGPNPFFQYNSGGPKAGVSPFGSLSRNFDTPADPMTALNEKMKAYGAGGAPAAAAPATTGTRPSTPASSSNDRRSDSPALPYAPSRDAGGIGGANAAIKRAMDAEATAASPAESSVASRYPDGMAGAIRQSAKDLGISAEDLATMISFETGGTFDPWAKGPVTKWGRHRGLIQWGEPQAAAYKVHKDMPVGEQMKAVTEYLKARGVRPGMSGMNVYAAINAGHASKINASDAAAGGTWGTVADKWLYQMKGHRQKARALLGPEAPDVEEGRLSARPGDEMMRRARGVSDAGDAPTVNATGAVNVFLGRGLENATARVDVSGMFTEANVARGAQMRAAPD